LLYKIYVFQTFEIAEYTSTQKCSLFRN